MRNRSIIIGALLLAVAITVAIASRPSRSAARLLGDTTAITFAERGSEQPDRSFTVSDPVEVQRIVGTIRLKSNPPCPCSHLHKAAFQKATGQIQVSFCGHCFDVLSGQAKGSCKGYEMPEGFYEEFRRLALGRSNEEWHVQQ